LAGRVPEEEINFLAIDHYGLALVICTDRRTNLRINHDRNDQISSAFTRLKTGKVDCKN
jgi:hypothetical protein